MCESIIASGRIISGPAATGAGKSGGQTDRQAGRQADGRTDGRKERKEARRRARKMTPPKGRSLIGPFRLSAANS